MAAWQRAERHLTEALLHQPARADLYYGRARLRHRLGAVAGATADYTVALARGFRDPVRLLVRRAEARWQEGDEVGARDDLAAAVARGAGDARPWAARSIYRHCGGDHVGAIEDIDRAIELEPCRASHYRNRSAYLVALDRVDAALADLDRAAALESRSGALGASCGDFALSWDGPRPSQAARCRVVGRP